jgi:uncharacterized protein YjbI with pentapeptide repeats
VQRHPARGDGPPVTGLAGTFVVKGTFRLVPGGPAEPWADGPEPLAGDMPWPDEPDLGLSYPSDFVPWKPRGEWIVVGMARPPMHYPLDAAGDPFAWQGEGDTRRFMIRVAVGRSEKRLEVFGERHWVGRLVHLASRPKAAEDATPLSYALAWGGPGHPTNPIGTGYGGGSLPRFERPGARTETFRDDRDPAGLGAVPADWPQRAALRGTHDDRWLATLWPWLPEDVDYDHFLSTAPDQWVDGCFRGDEAVSLVHLHPTCATFAGLLPGIRPRLAVVRRSPVTESSAAARGFDRDRPLPAEEVPLVLDTVWIDADREKLVLVWRGLAAIATPKMPDIASVTLAAERLDEPLAAIETFIVMGDAGEAPAEGPTPAAEPLKPDPGAAARAKACAAMIDEAVAEVAAVTEKLETSGAFARIEQAAATALSPAERRAQLEQLAVAHGPGSTAARQLELLDELAFVQAAAEQVLAATGAEQAARKRSREAAAVARVLPRLPDGTVDVAEASRRGWRTIDLAGADLSGLDLAGADFAGAEMSGVNLAGAALTGANLAGARLVEATLAAANLAGASLVGANLGRADLSRANLSGADLSHGDVTGARVSAVDWRGCRLTAAKLAGLDLYAADFSGCVADHADFAGANLADATFCDAHLAMASFAKANVERVTFSRAVLEWTAFGEAIACGTTFTECDLGKVRAGQGDFRRATFTRCRGPEPVFEAARLDGATFVRCELPRARFAEAALTGATIDRSDLRQAVFEDACLADTRLMKSNLFEAVFDRANLTGASLAGSNAYGCGFWESVVDRLDVAGAIVGGTAIAGESAS